MSISCERPEGEVVQPQVRPAIEGAGRRRIRHLPEGERRRAVRHEDGRVGRIPSDDRPAEEVDEERSSLLDVAEEDVLAFMSFPKEHRAKIHSTNPLERLNGEVKRRTDVVGIFPNEAAITRLVGAILLEQNDEWAVQRARYMTLETIAPLRDDLSLMLPTSAA